jgi:site-specific recombinase XerD
LDVDRRVSASTQNQALIALLFVYQKVLGVELPRIAALRARRPGRVPVVLSVEEVRHVFEGMAGRERRQAERLYGTGMRVLECCRLRVKDVDVDRRRIVARDGKGGKDRVVPLAVCGRACVGVDGYTGGSDRRSSPHRVRERTTSHTPNPTQ